MGGLQCCASPEEKTFDEKKFKREQNDLLSQECRNSHTTFASLGANSGLTPQSRESKPIMNLYAESLCEPSARGTEQEYSFYDESERGATHGNSARKTPQDRKTEHFATEIKEQQELFPATARSSKPNNNQKASPLQVTSPEIQWLFSHRVSIGSYYLAQ